MKRKSYFLYLILLLFWSCNERFDNVKVLDVEERFVVESFISNIDSFTVTLTKTTNFPSADDVPKISGASVKIINDLADTVILTESFVGSGTYGSSNIGVVGRSYKLSISIGSVTYESPFIEMFNQVTIDALFVRQDPDQNNEYFAFACFEDDINSRDFYIWFYDTYKKDDVNGGVDESNTRINFNVFDDRFINGLSTCLDDSLLIDVNDETFEPIDTFFVLQKYHINEDAADYWNQVLVQTQFVGGPFDVPPSPIVGNVRNIENENDFMLGYFMVGGKDVDTVIVPEIK